MDLSEYLQSFQILGEQLNDCRYFPATLQVAVHQQTVQNKWFIKEHIFTAIAAVAEMLSSTNLQKIADYYVKIPNLDFTQNKKIAVISAGNIPLSGFHDFFSVLISGNQYIGKLSSKDSLLLPVVADMLIKIEPKWRGKITFTDKFTHFEKVIASGSNNTVRYFEYYFGKYPHVFRKSRRSLAILTGQETEQELLGLFQDCFLYFGQGCRSVSMLYVPENYDFNPFIKVMNKQGKEIAQHHAYLNNLDYRKTLYLMNNYPFIDAGISLLAESSALSSPIGVLHYQYYKNIDEVQCFIKHNQENIQCVTGNHPGIKDLISFGRNQFPAALDYADKIDVVLWGTKIFTTFAH